MLTDRFLGYCQSTFQAELVRNQWRQFNYLLDTTGRYVTIPVNTNTVVNQLAVNVESSSLSYFI